MRDLNQASYFVVFFTTAFSSMEDVWARAPDALRRHLERTRRLHADGVVLMAGAFVEPKGGPVSTMAVLATREAAEEFVRGDPFVELGQIAHHEIREWNNMLR
ncbi:MAG TPA: YciI family protein [Candidatus Dormibacteraeota bacterium]|nr:YciI family protein [Candidatus Dormibacteraeota bacterium]